MITCVVCPKCYEPTTPDFLEDHLKHDCIVEKPYKCEMCTYRTKYKLHLKNHRFNRHFRPKDAIRSYECAKCSKKYVHKDTLQRHLRLECGKEATLKCLYCQYKSKYNSSLKAHYKARHKITFL